MKRGEVEKVKAFVTRTHDRARPAYGRRRIDAPRRCIFIATTNEDSYLKAQTGNRRFWPVKTGTIDIEALRRDRDQLWAEAAHAEQDGMPLVLPLDLWASAKAEQEKRLEPDPWDDILSGLQGHPELDDKGADVERIFGAEILRFKLEIPPDRQRPLESIRLKNVMNRLGWSGPKKIRIAGKQDRGYWRPKRKPQD
jgi:hypothetical protein